ncbi:MAG: four helix bundle protein [Actinomycetota bacterium]|nr:four helix bundle protein [Actinomycetota bacterium]MDK1037726.1 four helix bundle protein [Actinomycetota bacterium]MDK1095991.1 four helix bundle protein [Actinomycetota bacterium]MDK1102245.1 four helix bundle protein [Actinomycetota bacterium]
MHNYRRLRVYELVEAIAIETYRLTEGLPGNERWGLVQQMNRSAVSIVSNIAEGAGRGDDRDFARFLRIARGSSCELEAQANLCVGLGLLSKSNVAELRDAVDRIQASITKLNRRLIAT